MLPLIASPWFKVIRVTTDKYPGVETHKNKKLELCDFCGTEIHNQILQHLVADIVLFISGALNNLQTCSAGSLNEHSIDLMSRPSVVAAACKTCKINVINDYVRFLFQA